jgi:ATP-dependent helicase/nuclease subunit A
MTSDHAARAAITTDLDVNMMVEAAAGTGKTTSLVTRAVALIRTGRCRIDTLAAITFTVKAAAQLRERLQEELETQAATSDDGGLVRRALHDLDRALIGTTHAFCARMLRERPVESSIDPDFEELDDVDARLLMDDFWSRWFEAEAIKGSAEMRAVAETAVKPKVLREAFFRLVEYADVEIVSTPCERRDLKHAVQTVVDFLETCQPSFPDESKP